MVCDRGRISFMAVMTPSHHALCAAMHRRLKDWLATATQGKIFLKKDRRQDGEKSRLT